MTGLALLLLAALALSSGSPGRALTPTRKKPMPLRGQRQHMIDLITAECQKQGVPARIALAFASIESGLHPDAEGDPRWYLMDGGERYRRYVLDNPDMQENPARLDREAWHSYGLFQLNAARNCGPLEHPRELLDPVRNVRGGVAKIAALLASAKGDVHAARLAYVGCGLTGSKCAKKHVAQVLAILDSELAKWPGDST
jgi:hypothetical protein